MSDELSRISMCEGVNLSWTHEYVKSETIHSCEPMEQINIHFVYVNRASEIEKVVVEEYPLKLKYMVDVDMDADADVDMDRSKASSSFISEQLVLQLIQSKKMNDDLGRRYKLDDILLHFVTLDPANLFDYAKHVSDSSSSSSSFLKTLHFPGEIVVPPTLFIFHPLNTIYFIFSELTLVPQKPLVSILKNPEKRTSTTKKVRIVENDMPIRKVGAGFAKTAKIRIL